MKIPPELWHMTGSLEEGKQCHYIMIEADIHLRPLHTTILDRKSVCAIGMLSQENMVALAALAVTLAKLAPNLGSQV
jgi:hypothetical protein